jgi:ABC-2 type transport system ATP-binding protein
MTAIELDSVSKRFGSVLAVDDLSLSVEEGEVFGFLGPNGAGKTTTIDMILDFARPSDGTISVLGHDAQRESVAVRRRTGVLPEGFDVYDRLTGRKHLEFAIESKGTDEDPEELLARVGLGGEGGRKAGGYSKGMAQRLAFAMALVGDPELLILDEPSTGLDPNGAMEMREIVREEVDRGTTVFFSSHVLGQVEAVCDRVAILRAGELVALDTIEGLRDAVETEATLSITLSGGSDDAVAAVRALSGVSSVEANGTGLRVSCEDDAKTRVLTTLEAEGASVSDFETEEASLESLFAAYTTDEPDRTEVEARP